MAESKIQNAFSRTAMLTVGKLLAFIAAGFAIGLVLGVASEEPALLAGHLRGDSETIELDAALAGRVEQSEANARELAARERAAGEAEAEREADGDPHAGESEARRIELPDVAAAPPDDSDPEFEAAIAGRAPSAAGAGRDAETDAESRGGGDASPDTRSNRLIRVPSDKAGERWAIQVGAFGDEPSANRLVEQLEVKGYQVAVLPAGAESNRWRVRVQPIASERTARETAARIEREEGLPIWVIRLEGSAPE